jgi:hypothetical protein
MNGSRLGVVRTINQSADSGMHHCSGTHGARLNRGIELAIAQAMVADRSSGLAECENLSMGGRIGISNVAIETSANDLSRTHDHCAHRNFSGVKRTLGGAQRLLHPQFILLQFAAASHGCILAR